MAKTITLAQKFGVLTDIVLTYVPEDYEVEVPVAEDTTITLDRKGLLDFIADRKEKLKKNTSAAASVKRKTAKAEENAPLMDDIVRLLSDGARMTATEIYKASESIGAYSPQKASSLANALVAKKVISKTSEKGKTLFYIPDAETDSDAE